MDDFTSELVLHMMVTHSDEDLVKLVNELERWSSLDDLVKLTNELEGWSSLESSGQETSAH